MLESRAPVVKDLQALTVRMWLWISPLYHQPQHVEIGCAKMEEHVEVEQVPWNVCVSLLGVGVLVRNA